MRNNRWTRTNKLGGIWLLSKIDSELYNLDNAICRHIDNISRDSRGMVSQDILSDLRHYVEHIMFKIYDNGKN